MTTQNTHASQMVEPRLGGGQAWLIWIIAVTFVVFLFSIQTGYAVVNSPMQQSIGVTVVQVGIIAATYTWVFAVSQFYGGAILDQLGARWVLPISMGLVTIGAFIFANATSFPMLLLSQAVLAIGSCTGFVGAGYVGGKWFGMAKFGIMFGLVQVVAAATSAFSQNLIGWALTILDWRTLFNYIGIFGIFLTLIGVLLVRDPVPVTASVSGPGRFIIAVTKALFDVARQPMVLLVSGYGALTFGTMLALGVIWAPRLVMAHGVDEPMAYLATSMLWIGLAVGSAIVPGWSERMHSRRLPNILGTVVQLASLAVLLYVDQLNGVACIILLFIFGFGNAAHMLAFSVAADIVPPEKIGTSAAVVNGLMFIAGGVLMGLPGARFEAAYLQGLESLSAARYALLPLVIVVGVALVLTLLIRETHPEAAAKVGAGVH